MSIHRRILAILRYGVSDYERQAAGGRGRTARVLGLALTVLLWPGSWLAAQAVDPAGKRITLAMATEPPSLDSLQATDSESFFLLSHLMEGLAQYDERGELVPGVASHWQIGPDGATFHLRRDARWSDGVPVTAEQFVYAWREALDPGNGAPYASILYPLKNARRINNGELPKTALAVHAPDPFTLQLEFERPCPYFLGLTAFATYFPRRSDVVDRFGARFAAEADTMVYNGPYQLERWVHGASLKLARNPHYWDRARLAVHSIAIPYMTTSPQATLNLFKDGAIAFTGLDDETLKEAAVQGYQVRRFRNGVIFYVQHNFRAGRPTTNRHLRRALQLIFSSDTLVNKVIAMPGNKALYSLYPSTLAGVSATFQDEFPPPTLEPDLREARLSVARAREAMGGEIPPLTLLVSESPSAVRIGEYLQNLFRQALGLDIRLDKQIFKQRIAKMQSGEFDMVLAGWGPDFDDPITYGDLFASWNENNRGHYRSDAYDHWVAEAQRSVEPGQRMEALAQLQRILHEDAAILPLYEGASAYLVHPALRHMGRSLFGGDPSYKFARLVQE